MHTYFKINPSDHSIDDLRVVNRIRGATKEVRTDETDAEATDANGIDDLTLNDGFGLGTGAGGYNDSGEDHVAWQWFFDNTTGAPNAATTIGFCAVAGTPIQGPAPASNTSQGRAR